ncbi:MAG: preprotein translocase subunit YajC [Planctomycetota bacterium]|nr:preprotein translocase subunit YajC [Planctomycetota bacterium]
MFDLVTIIAQTAESAPPVGGPPQEPWAGTMNFVVIMAVMFVIFYLLVIRPENQRKKKREEMLAGLKKRDQVVTVGGMIGMIEELDGDEVVLLVDRRKDVRMRLLRKAIESVYASPETEKAAKDAAKETAKDAPKDAKDSKAAGK